MVHGGAVPYEARFPARPALLRIAAVLFTVETLIMLFMPWSGMDQWLATFLDSALLTLISTPLVYRWVLGITPYRTGYSPDQGRTLLVVAGKFGLAVFSAECAAMLLLSVLRLPPGSWVEALGDASLLTIVATPMVYFLIVPEGVRTRVTEHLPQGEVARWFLLIFLPVFLLLSVVTEAVFHLEIHTKEQVLEKNDVHRLEMARHEVLRELESVMADLLILSDQAEMMELLAGAEESKRLLSQDYVAFLRIKGRFSRLRLLGEEGEELIRVEYGDGQPLLRPGSQQERDFDRHFLQKTMAVAPDEIFISSPLLDPAGLEKVLLFGVRIFDEHKRPRGALLLDYPGSRLTHFLDSMSQTLTGTMVAVDEDLNPLSQTDEGVLQAVRDSVAPHFTQDERGRVGSKGGWFAFTAIHPPGRLGPHSRIRFGSQEAATRHQHGVHGPTWHLVSFLSREKAMEELLPFRGNLLMLQSLLAASAALGAWLLARGYVSRRAAEARNERAHQSRITISGLLETALEPLDMTRQLSAALEIIQTTPWMGFLQAGAFFLADGESNRLSLIAQRGFSGSGGADLPSESCLCGSSASKNSIMFFPPGSDSSAHICCLDHPASKGRYCVPVFTRQRLLGVMTLHLKRTPKGSREEEEAFLTTVAATLAEIVERRFIEDSLQRTNQELRKTRADLIHRLGMAAEYRDQDTGQHVVRMARYAERIAQAAGLTPEECETILQAAPMHDVGKIGIPDHILLKPGRLTEEEFTVMKNHTLIGSYMLHGYDSEPMNTAHIIALTHHERWDGKGYPIGVPKEEIPIEGRICAIADVFDALTTERPYKHAWSVERAVEEISRGRGTQFDPHLVDVFLSILPDIIRIKESYADEEFAA